MYDLLSKIAEAAQAAAGAPADGEEEMLPPPPDPIEMDNQRLNNVLQNLQLRQQIVEAQQALEAATSPKTRRRRSSRDPDKPRKGGPKGPIDLSTASTLEGMLKNTPKSKKKSEPEVKGKESKEGRAVKPDPDNTGQNDPTLDTATPDGTKS